MLLLAHLQGQSKFISNSRCDHVNIVGIIIIEYKGKKERIMLARIFYIVQTLIPTLWHNGLFSGSNPAIPPHYSPSKVEKPRIANTSLNKIYKIM